MNRNNITTKLPCFNTTTSKESIHEKTYIAFYYYYRIIQKSIILVLLFCTQLLIAQETIIPPLSKNDVPLLDDDQQLYVLYTTTFLTIPFISTSDEINDVLDNNKTYNRLAHTFGIRYTYDFLLLDFSYIFTEDAKKHDASFYASQMLTLGIGAQYSYSIVKNILLTNFSIAASLLTAFANYNQESGEDTTREQLIYLGVGLQSGLHFDFVLNKNMGLIAGIDMKIYYVPLGSPIDAIFVNNNKLQSIYSIGSMLGLCFRL